MTSWREKHGWYWLSIVLPVSATAAFQCGHPWFFLLCLVVAILVGDTLLGAHLEDGRGQCDAVSIGAGIPLGFICVWLLALILATAHSRHAAPLDFAGLMAACGALSAFAMAHIHEVMHRGNRAARLISVLALTLAGYPHYRSVHQLHHEHVGDPRYGSTARVGVSLWRHVTNSFSLALLAALRHEQQRCRSGGTSGLLWPAASLCGTLTAFAVFDGLRGVFFYLGQSMLSVFVVEGIGYIQHYGLNNPPVGGDEQVAWDVGSWLSNRLFVNNGFHTHHHFDQTRTYDRLKLVGTLLPAGYLHMFLLALVPPLWFSVMDRRLKRDAYFMSKDKSQE
jgi:alkane 1-monooxygenase